MKQRLGKTLTVLSLVLMVVSIIICVWCAQDPLFNRRFQAACMAVLGVFGFFWMLERSFIFRKGDPDGS